jgi:hypothetical protein
MCANGVYFVRRLVHLFVVFMEIIETPIFSRRVQKVLTNDEYQQFLTNLAHQPDMGVVLRGGGGIRKVRWAAKGHGKRGGVRIIYHWAAAQDKIIMLFIYAKNEQDDLSREQLRALRKVVEEELS